MKKLFVALVAAFVFALATGAFADSIDDPKIIIKDPVCPSGGCIQAGTHFTFSTPAAGIGSLFFTNASGVNWTSLSLTEAGVAANLITCITDVFASCQVTTSSNGITTILLSGVGGNFSGLLTGQNFQIIFGCKAETADCNPWPGNLQFTGVANVPEPGTMALVATGLGMIVRRRWRKAPAA